MRSTGGVTDIPFDREAASLSAAVHSAIEQVRSAGLEVDRVVIDRQDLARLLGEPEPPVTAEGPAAGAVPAPPVAAAA